MEGWTGLGEEVPGNFLGDEQKAVQGLGGTRNTYYRPSKAVQEAENNGEEVKRNGNVKDAVATTQFDGNWLPPGTGGWDQLIQIPRGTRGYERQSDQMRLLRLSGWVTVDWPSESWTDIGLATSSFNVNTKQYAGVNLQMYMRLKPAVVAGSSGGVIADATNTNYPQVFNEGWGGVNQEESVWTPYLYKEIINNDNVRVLWNAGAKPVEQGEIVYVDTTAAPVSWEITQRLGARAVVVPFDVDCTNMPIIEFDPAEQEPRNVVIGLSAAHQPTQSGIDFVNPTVRMMVYAEWVDEHKRHRYY